MRTILILNGPNLNMLGFREPEIYGRQTLADIEELCRAEAAAHHMAIDFRQSNHEGQLVDWIQMAMGRFAGIMINAAAYTHTSVAIHDALKLHNIPIVEIHLSDPATREGFRHFSYIEPLATAIFKGEGAESYRKGIAFLSTGIKP